LKLHSGTITILCYLTAGKKKSRRSP